MISQARGGGKLTSTFWSKMVVIVLPLSFYKSNGMLYVVADVSDVVIVNPVKVF